MFRGLAILVAVLQQRTFTGASYVGADITKALQNINEMENDLMRFYRQWDSLSTGMAAQGTKRALETCSSDHKTTCTPEKQQAISICVTTESKTIHDAVVRIYDDKIRKPWEREFETLRTVLKNPAQHESEIEQTIWTVHQETFSEKSVRYRFYTTLINFQLPNVAPHLYPLDKVYKLCLERLFPQINKYM